VYFHCITRAGQDVFLLREKGCSVQPGQHRNKYPNIEVTPKTGIVRLMDSGFNVMANMQETGAGQRYTHTLTISCQMKPTGELGG